MFDESIGGRNMFFNFGTQPPVGTSKRFRIPPLEAWFWPFLARKNLTPKNDSPKSGSPAPPPWAFK